MGPTNFAFLTLGLVLLGITDSVQGSCPSLWTKIGDMCYHKTDELMTHSDAADFCSTLSTTYGAATLATFPRCDDFAKFAAYLGLTAPTEGNYWVGAKTDFLGNWYWETLETLQLGVPFWAYSEGGDKGEDCAAMDRRFRFQLMDDDCETMKGAACMAPASATREYNKTKDFEVLDCPDGTTQVGDHCYYFSYHESNWHEADWDCQDEDNHRHWHGELFSPSSCEEFTHMAHHLQAENDHDYWVGGIDASGYNEWTWVSGDTLPIGIPYWAYGQPDHSGHGYERYECTKMSGDVAHYLDDYKCSWDERYICKVHIV
ncbi:unnamed protein product [Meganyctiphanes norvegica]|uniref:C-type lectin domain-containing protein n=1 Tax=Meganyctiphanes norvegica TaxID=48144 RepID=A0AAV2RBZ2_MEGNR